MDAINILNLMNTQSGNKKMIPISNWEYLSNLISSNWKWGTFSVFVRTKKGNSQILQALSCSWDLQNKEDGWLILLCQLSGVFFAYTANLFNIMSFRRVILFTYLFVSGESVSHSKKKKGILMFGPWQHSPGVTKINTVLRIPK